MQSGTEEQPSLDDLLRETLEFLTVEPVGDGFGAKTPDWFGEYLFGGFVVAQAIVAATRRAREGHRMHSMHAYFLRPVRAAAEISYEVAVLREGRTFATHELRAQQDGKPVLAMTSSFTADTDGYVYDLGGSEPLPALDDSSIEPGPGPWIASYVGPSTALPDGTRTSTHRHWFKIPSDLGDDAHVHTALLGFATDWTGIGGRPLRLEGDTTGMISLDHAVWFHRPARVDKWLFYDVQSLVNAGGRGTLRGVIRDQAGSVVASAAQEMLLIPIS